MCVCAYIFKNRKIYVYLPSVDLKYLENESGTLLRWLGVEVVAAAFACGYESQGNVPTFTRTGWSGVAILVVGVVASGSWFHFPLPSKDSYFKAFGPKDPTI